MIGGALAVGAATRGLGNKSVAASLAKSASELLNATGTGVVHLAGAETITGVKSFDVAPVVPAAAFPKSAVSGLVADLAAKQASIPPGTLAPVANPTFTGEVTAPNLVFTVQDPSGAGYAMYQANDVFESGLYADATMNWGYNVSSTPGVKAVTTEPMLFWQLESRFRQDSSDPYGSEAHLNFARPNDIAVHNRPIYIFMEHVTGKVQTFFAGRVNITGSGNNEPRYVFGESGTGPAGFFDQGGVSCLYNTEGAASTAEVTLSSDARYPYLSWRNAGLPVAELSADITTGLVWLVPHGGFVVRTDVATSRNITIQAAPSQSAHTFLIQASDQFTTLSYFNKVGRFHTAVNTAPILADLADGEMAIWVDATSGNLKLTSRVAGALKNATVKVA